MEISKPFEFVVVVGFEVGFFCCCYYYLVPLINVQLTRIAINFSQLIASFWPNSSKPFSGYFHYQVRNSSFISLHFLFSLFFTSLSCLNNVNENSEITLKFDA